jgi:hypothetical protein
MMIGIVLETLSMMQLMTCKVDFPQLFKDDVVLIHGWEEIA